MTEPGILNRNLSDMTEDERMDWEHSLRGRTFTRDPEHNANEIERLLDTATKLAENAGLKPDQETIEEARRTLTQTAWNYEHDGGDPGLSDEEDALLDSVWDRLGKQWAAEEAEAARKKNEGAED